MKSLPFHIPEGWKRCPFRVKPSRTGHHRKYPTPPAPRLIPSLENVEILSLKVRVACLYRDENSSRLNKTNCRSLPLWPDKLKDSSWILLTTSQCKWSLYWRTFYCLDSRKLFTPNLIQYNPVSYLSKILKLMFPIKAILFFKASVSNYVTNRIISLSPLGAKWIKRSHTSVDK